MDVSLLVAWLQQPGAVPNSAEAVEVRQTHISAVFLTRDFVYKIKKPVQLGFLDFSTLQKRKHFCEEEVRLNRRLAPRVYLGVVPITLNATGAQFEGVGEPIEWAVKMRRLPDKATLESRIHDGQITQEQVRLFGKRLAQFHDSGHTDERMAALGSYEAVSRNILDVFGRSETHIGLTVHPYVFQKIKELTQRQLIDHRATIENRAKANMTRDCHGDLHLDHVYFFPEATEPDNLVIIDCIEFNENFRFIDPIADMGFAVMDFHFYGRRDLAQDFQEVYFAEHNDPRGQDLVPLYTAYRATVRGMVDGVLLTEKEVPQAERLKAIKRGKAHWLLALVELAPAREKPCLLMVGGLPGSGKSTLVRLLSEACGFEVIRSDVVRKQLCGFDPNQPTPSDQTHLLYTPEQTARVYTECHRLASELIFQGKRVIIDATFRDEIQRQGYLQLAVDLGVPGLLVLCQATPETIQTRLNQRTGDPSDADWSVYQKLAKEWEPPKEAPGQTIRTISTDEGTANAALEVKKLLEEVGLF